MAAIDKTYVTKEQLIQAYEWAKNIGDVTLENGHVFRPLDFICYYDMNNLPELNEYVLWNTPTWFDRWFWRRNFPLPFVYDRLEEVYDEETLREFDLWSYDKQVPEKRKYKFIEVPTGKYIKTTMRCARYKNPWPGKCIQATYEIKIGPVKEVHGKLVIDSLNEYGYDEQTDSWGHWMGMLPYHDNFIWQRYMKRIPNKKTILRLIRQWNIPSGYMVHVSSLRYKGLDFKVLVK